MPLTKIKIDGVGGIIKLEVKFDPFFNIICGPNGIGKSTILDAIDQSLAMRQSRVKRNARFNRGQVSLEGSIADQMVLITIHLNKFFPDDDEHIQGQYKLARWVVNFPAQRELNYSKLIQIAPDPAESDIANRALTSGLVAVHDIKNWFVYRFLYSVHENVLSPAQKANHALASDLFGLLEIGFKFGTVEAKKSEIMVDTPTGRIPFEYLSSGFRSCVILVWGLIKEIEHRFPAEGCNAKEFSGLVLIDEIEIHLHPNWQQTICSALRLCFPKAQFIVTTHSPHVIQSADPRTVLPLQSNEDGSVSTKLFGSLPYGFQGWTLEEILTDVMGVDKLEGSEYHNAVIAFSRALSERDIDASKAIFDKLDVLLHPNNYFRDIFRRQLNDLIADHD